MIEPSQLSSARKRVGLTQSELARRSGVSQSLIAKIEADLLDPSFSKLKALSDVIESLATAPHPTAERIMHRDVILMYATEPVHQAVEHLARHGISQLPVVDEGSLVGTVTESSLLGYVTKHQNDPRALGAPVRDVMTDALPQVPPETSADSLASLLDLFPAVLVTANGRVQGIITRSDLLRSLAAQPGAGNGYRAK